MNRKLLASIAISIAPALALPAMATEYPFPTNMKVTIERGDEPIEKTNSSVVYPIINKFMVSMPNGDAQFVLERETGEVLPMVANAGDYLIQSPVTLGENVFFGTDTQTAGTPVRVMVQGPINLGHVHFSSSSAILTKEAKAVLREMANQMQISGLLGAYLVGMTDRAGSEDANLSLSLKRVNAASKYLSKKLNALGVTGAVIKTEYMGEYESASKDGVVNPFDRKVSVLVYPVI